MNNIDTTLPRQETEFSKPRGSYNTGYANVVAVVGKAKYSDPEATIINDYDDVNAILGEPTEGYPAGKIIKELFEQRIDPDSGNVINGASKVIFVDVAEGKEAGEAIIQMTDSSSNEVDAIKLTFKTAGERTGYSLDVAKSGLGYDILIKNGTEIVDGEAYYDVSPAELINEINLTSQLFKADLVADLEDANFIDDLKEEVIPFSNGSDGTVVGDIKNAIINALNLIKLDTFDHICFGLELNKTDIFNISFLTKLKKYFAERKKNGKFSFLYLPNEVENNTPTILKEAVNRMKPLPEEYIRTIPTALNTDDKNRTMMESVAAYCGLVCGTPVSESTGNKVMSDVTGLSVYFEPEQHKLLLKKGITTFARRELVGGVHRVVSAVTGSQDFNTDGTQGELREEHVVRSIYYALNYFDLTGLLCSTGFEEATQQIKAYLTQKKTELVNAGIINGVEYDIVRDQREPRHVIIQYKSWDVKGIVKVITNRVEYNINLT